LDIAQTQINTLLAAGSIFSGQILGILINFYGGKNALFYSVVQFSKM